ncbi:MAG: ribosome small subunit-dependent GTPase A, partial [Eubacterium sp.]
GGYVADTPGFSSLDFERCEKILKEDLPYCFREFVPYISECKFAVNCSHINDKGCAVKKAVDDGFISQSRHNSYVQMYNDVKDIKEWEMK